MQYLLFALTALAPLTLGSETGDSCALEEYGPFSSLLVEWATQTSSRHGRIMALPPTKGYYVTDRIDQNLLPPPMQSSGPYQPMPSPRPYESMASGSGKPYEQMPSHYEPMASGRPYEAMASERPYEPMPSGRPYEAMASERPYEPMASGRPYEPVPSARPYEEWNMTPPGPGKIVNRPQKPYKDQFKPSLPPPQPPKPSRPLPSKPQRPQPPKIVNTGNTVDRVDEQPPRKEVSETDLYLLSAIEKLVYRADLMEKRLRKVEENLHRLIVGQNKQPAVEPCVGNFTRIGGVCYHFSAEPYDWKTSNLACRKLKASLVEFSSDHERKMVLAAVQASKEWKDADFWTGGLNPGLLWIWSNSGRPLFNNSASHHNHSDSSFGIAGEGRCLAVLFEPMLRTHVYRGQDCAYRHRFVCEKREDKARLSNEVERVAKSLRPLADSISSTAREARIYWTKDIQDIANESIEPNV